MHNEDLTLDDPVARENLERLLPQMRHVRLYYLVVGIIEGDIRWCDLLKVHRDAPLRAPYNPVGDDTKVLMLHILDGVLTKTFHRRHAFRVVRRTVVSRACLPHLPERLEAAIDKVMLRFANQAHPVVLAFLPVSISPE